MNLQQELEKSAKTRTVLKDFDPKALLLEAANEDIQTYKEIGLNSNIFIDAEESKAKRLAKAEAIYNQRTFEGSEIKDLCDKYYLKLLPISNYRGEFPSDLAKKIREYGETIGSTPKEMSGHLFILGPPNLFKTTKDKKPVRLSRDPILFYREPNPQRREWDSTEEDIFMQICNWGNDFSFLRRFAVLTESVYGGEESTVRGTVTIVSLMIFLIFAICVSFGQYGLGVIVSAIIAIITSFFIKETDADRKSNWNNNIV